MVPAGDGAQSDDYDDVSDADHHTYFRGTLCSLYKTTLLVSILRKTMLKIRTPTKHILRLAPEKCDAYGKAELWILSMKAPSFWGRPIIQALHDS